MGWTTAWWRAVLVLGMGLLVWRGADGDSLGAVRSTVYVAVPAAGVEGGEEAWGWAVPDEVVVRLRPEAGRAGRAIPAGLGGQVRWVVPRRGGQVAVLGGREGRLAEELAVVRLPAGTELGEAVRALSEHPSVAWAEPNWRLRTAVEPGGVTPSDFEFARQWALENTGQTGGVPGADIGARAAWEVTTGSSNVVVAIIDTGIDRFHPDLAPNLWRNAREVAGNGLDDDGNGYVDDVHGYDFVSRDGDPMDDNLHGTHVAGILGAVGDDENGVAGVAWSVRLMGLKAFDETGSGTLDHTIEAIAYAVSMGANIINASWGTTVRSRALDEMVEGAVARGVVFVAAAGNNGNETRFFPAAVPEAVAVGATTDRDESANFSNHGDFVDLVAPGEAIHATVPNAAWSTLSGTSMAAPHVSGAVALLLSVAPDLTPGQVRTILRSTADELPLDRYTGAGRLNAARVVGVREALPEAGIDMPAEWSGRLAVRGVAGGHRFAEYRLEIGAGRRPLEWTLLRRGTQPAAVGVLMEDFDTSDFDDGEYTVRLEVENHAGQVARERKGVTIRNVRMASPRNNDVLRWGEWVEIRGSVAGDGRVFEVAWGLGHQPAEWRTDGVALQGAGLGPRVDGVLARWDSRVVPADAFVTFRLTAMREGRWVGESQARAVHWSGAMREGWPRLLPFEDEFPVGHWREFAVADLNGDGRQEVVLVDHGEPGGRPPRLMAIGADGTVRWARDLPGGAPEYDVPVIGDLEGDGLMEIFVDTGDGGWIQGFRSDGEPLGGDWPVAPGGTHFGKLLADVTGDGRLELVALASPPPDLVSDPRRTLVVLDAGGRVLERWSVAGCAEHEINVPELRPAVANLDDDTALEIVVVDGCQSVSAFKLGRAGEPLWTAHTDAWLVASPVVGDLDGDGREEVILGGVARARGQPGGLYVFDREGRRRPGWPVLTGQSFHVSAALADLSDDGRLEIVVPSWDSGSLHVLRDDGFELLGWPVRNESQGAVRSGAVVGDIDGDGVPDVVLATPGFWLQVVINGDTTRSGGVRAWRADGSPIDLQPGRPAAGLVMETAAGATWHRYPAAVLADLDGNGRLDVVAASVQDREYSATPPVARAKMRSSLYAWELPAAVTSDTLPWPAAHGGPARTGRFHRPPPPNQAPVAQPLPHQTIDLGGTFRAIPLDRYVRDPDHPVSALEWRVVDDGGLRVTVETGRVLRVDPPRDGWEGRGTVVLAVRDPAGAEVQVAAGYAVVAGFRPPVAFPDSAATWEEEPLTLDPAANDVSPSGLPLRVTGVSRPGNGVAEVLADGRVRYTPAVDFFGVDTFEYTVTDGEGGWATGEVEVLVINVNDPPRPEPVRLVLDEDTRVEFDPLENDSDPDGDPLILVSIGTPEAGTLTALGDTRFLYVPPTNYHGQQRFFYVVGDPHGATATGEVAILVQPVNDAPVARDQVVTVNRNRSVDVFYDAEDVDGDPLTFTILEGPEHGILLAYPTLAHYEPGRGFVGTDRFTYRVSDGIESVGPVTVTLVVVDANNPPDVEPVDTVTAVDQPIRVGLAVWDVDGDPFTVRMTLAPAHGETRWEGTNVTYTPLPGYVGTDRFGYRASDGMDESAEAVVTIRVTDENTPPRAVSEVLTVGRNRTTSIQLKATDAENNPLRFEVVEFPTYGRIEGTPPAIEYAPLTGFRGVDRLQFTASDWEQTSEVATVHLLVRDPNTLPVVTNQTVRVRRDEAVSFRLAATDADGHPLEAAILKGPRFGRLYGSGIDFTYGPQAGYEGSDSFTYRVWDGYALSAEARVTMVVEAPRPAWVRLGGAALEDGELELRIEASPGALVRIETSEDLERWTVRVVLPVSEGSLRWRDGEGAGEAMRFYRVGVEGAGFGP
ncbi:MAG: tandem-95 repeat protein [Verrucomicrobiae bacterium]|nr:tandem-95 repeat protein [Verrucomicrobiae bacterium]